MKGILNILCQYYIEMDPIIFSCWKHMEWTKRSKKFKKKGMYNQNALFWNNVCQKRTQMFRIGPANRSRFILDFILNVSNSITDTM